MISFSNVKKSFGNYLVLEDFSLEVQKGEIFGLLALPDSGKTTVSKLVMGLLSPDRGDKDSLPDTPSFRKCGNHCLGEQPHGDITQSSFAKALLGTGYAS